MFGFSIPLATTCRPTFDIGLDQDTSLRPWAIFSQGMTIVFSGLAVHWSGLVRSGQVRSAAREKKSVHGQRIDTPNRHMVVLV